ncbi:UNVERIFIED_CONTAM: hypothetical protein Sangu_0841200 [Sesamum angustifolium]|uniref:Integrase catalytic domain-containing protein n=1 Tax=Sesamum angustifolium TaxID=2727405 RepID=A0AAW2PWY0_9LAMI
MIFAPIAVRKGIGRGIVLNSLPSKVLQISRKLSKDEVVLRLGDGKGELNNGLYILQMSDWIMTAQNKFKLDNFVNVQIWHVRLDHISQDRIKRLVDSKSLEIDNLENLLAYVCGPLNTQARGGFSYLITFTDDHSWYGYVYLMRYKSEAFVRFKEFRLEDHLKKNGIVSQWTPPGTPQLNGMVERRNRTLLDIVRSMMSFTELPLSFRGYALKTATRSTRVPQPPERYGFLAVISQLDNDLKTYGEAMSGIYLGKRFEAMKFEMDSLSSH